MIKLVCASFQLGWLEDCVAPSLGNYLHARGWSASRTADRGLVWVSEPPKVASREKVARRHLSLFLVTGVGDF